MNQILIEVFCAATIKKYDFWISKKLSIREITQILIEEIQEYEDNSRLFDSEDQVLLYLADRGVILNRDYTAEQAGLVSGQRIMMV